MRSKCKYGNPKKSSRFICCKCLNENCIAQGIQRGGKQREKNHIKDLYCVICNDVEKSIEVRYCDNYSEIMEKAKELHNEYYPS